MKRAGRVVLDHVHIIAGELCVRPHCIRMTRPARQLHLALRTPVVIDSVFVLHPHTREKLAAGASLLQVWTGFIYEGPFIVGRICRALSTSAPNPASATASLTLPPSPSSQLPSGV